VGEVSFVSVDKELFMAGYLIAAVIGSVVTLIARPRVAILWAKIVDRTENIKL